MADSMRTVRWNAISEFVHSHFNVSGPVEVTPQGPKKKKKKEDGDEEEAPPAAAVKAQGKADSSSRRNTHEYQCKHCGHKFRDTSHSKALEHILLVKDAQIKLCKDPQVSKDELVKLLNSGLKKAIDYSKRLAMHTATKCIAANQPNLEGASAEGPMSKQRLHALHKKQVIAALSKGGFSANQEANLEYADFLTDLNPDYKLLLRHEVDSIKDELHEERLQRRNAAVKQMSVGGLVSDGCRGKLHEWITTVFYTFSIRF